MVSNSLTKRLYSGGQTMWPDSPMLITCPKCATSYQVDSSSLSPAGQSVHCDRCGHVWFAANLAALAEVPRLYRIEIAEFSGALATPVYGPETLQNLERSIARLSDSHRTWQGAGPTPNRQKRRTTGRAQSTLTKRARGPKRPQRRRLVSRNRRPRRSRAPKGSGP
jgi:predicted Zn finger-like uncharacterized protein